VAWRFDQAKYRENDLRGRQWAFNVFSQTKPYMDEMVRNVTPLYTAPPQRERVQFPTMLRKMWSGGEVQAWLDENVNKEKNTS
jgi:hypothetical protein